MSKKYKAMEAWVIGARIAHDVNDIYGELYRLRLLKRKIERRQKAILKELKNGKQKRSIDAKHAA